MRWGAPRGRGAPWRVGADFVIAAGGARPRPMGAGMHVSCHASVSVRAADGGKGFGSVVCLYADMHTSALVTSLKGMRGPGELVGVMWGVGVPVPGDPLFGPGVFVFF